MSVPAEIRTIDYAGNGAATRFPVPFRFDDDAELVVTTTLDEEETLLVLDTDFSVELHNGRGTVVMTEAPEDDVVLTIARVVAITQPTVLVTQPTYTPALHEAALDRLTYVDQQLEARITALEAVDFEPVESSTVGFAALSANVDVDDVVGPPEVEGIALSAGDTVIVVPEDVRVDEGDPFVGFLFTAPKDGVYLMTLSTSLRLSATPGAVHDVAVYLRKNGVAALARTYCKLEGSDERWFAPTLKATAELVAGDYVQLVVKNIGSGWAVLMGCDTVLGGYFVGASD